MDGDGGRRREEISRRLDECLAGTAAVAAINDHGLFVPLPQSVPILDRHVLTGYASALDVVPPADAALVIEAWERALATGLATVRTHLVHAPSVEIELHLLDVRERHGVFLCFLDGPPEVAAVGAGDGSALRPRAGWLRKDQVAMILEADRAVAQMLGYPPQRLLELRSLDLLDPEDHSRAIAGWMSMLAEPGCRRRMRLRHRLADGSWRWFDVTNHNRLSDPQYGDILTEMVDVTDEMEAQEALRARENLLRRLTETLPVGVVQFAVDGALLFQNDRAAELLGVTSAVTLDDLTGALAAGDRRALVAAVQQMLAGGGDRCLELAVPAGPAGRRRVSVTLRPMTDEPVGVVGGLACLTDVTESVELREQLADRATYDALTRCRNRAAILAALDERLHRDDDGVAVVFVDLDGFKQVNDEQGHEAGDRVLVEFSRRLAAGVRGDDVVGRLGGDEFLVVCSDVGSRKVAERIGRRIARAVQPLVGDSPLRASIGVAWSADGATTADALVAEADQAMYESKRDGRGRPVVRDLVVSGLPRPRGAVSASSAAADSAPGGTGRSTRG